MRLIDADALKFPTAKVKLDDAGIAKIEGYHMAIETVRNAPTIDAEPVVHARWVHEQRYGDSGGWVWRCSACRHEAISPIISALMRCHHCGAKMDAPRGEDDGHSD